MPVPKEIDVPNFGFSKEQIAVLHTMMNNAETDYSTMLGDELSALFIIISDTDATFNFLVAIMYSQLFNLLCTKADNSKGGRLKYHVRCLLDEFANSVTCSVLKRCST